MSDPKRPTDKARETLQRGVSEMFRAAKSAGKGIKREIDKGTLGKTIEDSGKELLRAATNVAKHVGAEIETLSQKAQSTFEPSSAAPPPPSPTGVPYGSTAPQPTALQWPETRDEFERRFGKVAGDWPRSADEFERRFGYAPRDKTASAAKDSGFRIATDNDPK